MGYSQLFWDGAIVMRHVIEKYPETGPSCPSVHLFQTYIHPMDGWFMKTRRLHHKEVVLEHRKVDNDKSPTI